LELLRIIPKPVAKALSLVAEKDEKSLKKNKNLIIDFNSGKIF
jgi:hypothetical protein